MGIFCTHVASKRLYFQFLTKKEQQYLIPCPRNQMPHKASAWRCITLLKAKGIFSEIFMVFTYFFCLKKGKQTETRAG
jgi:hypothetical protein